MFFSKKEPSEVDNTKLILEYSAVCSMLPLCKKERKKELDEYGKLLMKEILTRMGGPV